MRRILSLLLASAVIAAPSEAGAQEPPFAACNQGARVTFVVDGDTLWLGGVKIRLADINTPETAQADCPREAALGRAATARLIALLNLGPVVFERPGGARERDRYGRLLRVVTRAGESLGAVLVREGLAEPWSGRRRNWCGAA